MQFQSHATDLDIIDDITFWTGATTTDYTINDRTRSCNLGLDRVLMLIMQADGRWKFDDINNTGEPTGTFDLVADQNYVEVTGATYLKITKVMVLDGSYYKILDPVGEHSADAENLLEKRNSGTPARYLLKGENVYLDPYPASALTNGLKIFCQKNVHYFTTTDTTAEPGFAQPFHRLIPLYASKDYLSKMGMTERLAAVINEINILEAGLIKFYSNRNPEDQPRLRMRKETYGARHLSRLGGGGRSSNPKTIE